MKIKAVFEKKTHFIATPFGPCIWVFLLWHTGIDLPGHTSYNRERVNLQNIYINNNLLDRVFSLHELRSYAQYGAGAYYQENNKVYIKMRHISEEALSMSAQEWLFSRNIYSISFAITDGYFFVANDMRADHGILSGYKLKINADSNSYSQIRFSTFSISCIWDKIKKVSDTIIGSSIVLSTIEDDQRWERISIENIVRGIDTAKLSLKDIRSAFGYLVIDQQYKREEYRNARGNIIMDEDTGKDYKKDAIGYCIGVPADCLNGYAFDTEQTRKYRASYGSILVDYVEPNMAGGEHGMGVEIEMENSYKILPYLGQPSIDQPGWWYETIQEKLPNGSIIDTTIIVVPAYVAHPAQTGYTQPDYETSPRKLRVTGTFHSELSGNTNCLSIFEYLIRRYSRILYNQDWFNTEEIQNELAVFDNHPIGIFIDKPTELWKVIAQLQNGCIYGWQFCSYKSLMTARVDLPVRPITAVITRFDIMNINSLQYDFCGSDYSTNNIIKYSSLYKTVNNEDAYKEYKDDKVHDTILSIRNTEKNLVIDTLLKNASDAQLRFNEVVKNSVNLSPSINGIILEGRKWFNLRQFDYVDIDLQPLADRGIWKIVGIELDFGMENVKVDIKKADREE